MTYGIKMDDTLFKNPEAQASSAPLPRNLKLRLERIETTRPNGCAILHVVTRRAFQIKETCVRRLKL